MPKTSSFAIKIPLVFRFLANSMSVKRSPITYELAKSYSLGFKYFVSIPVLGFRVGALSLGKLLSINTSSKIIHDTEDIFQEIIYKTLYGLDVDKNGIIEEDIYEIFILGGTV